MASNTHFLCWSRIDGSFSSKNELNFQNSSTRFEPNRPAADKEGNGEFDFWVSHEEFWRIVDEFCRN